MVSLPICQATLRLGVGGMKAEGGGESNGEREEGETKSEWRWESDGERVEMGERRKARGDGRERVEKVSSRIFSISSITS